MSNQPPSIFRDFDPHRNFQVDRSAYDRARHRARLKQAIRDNLQSIISNESLIGHDKGRKVRVKIQGLKEYRFVFGENGGIAQGEGDTQEGQTVGKGQPQDDGHGHGGPGHGGDGQEDIYETEISMEEIISILYEDLELPGIEQKKLKEIESDQLRKLKGYKRVGIPSHFSRFKTARERVKRKAASKRHIDSALLTDSTQEEEPRFPFNKKDLRYKRFDVKPKKSSNAVIFFMRDGSGSIDENKIFLMRSYFFLLYQFIKTKYDKTETVFILHDSDAKEVNQEQFFTRTSMGGTLIAPAFKLLEDIVQDRYNPELWNVYVLYSGDGESFAEDNAKLYSIMLKLLPEINLLSYCEVCQTDYSTLSKFLTGQGLDKENNFKQARIDKKEDIWPAVKSILSKDKNQ